MSANLHFDYRSRLWHSRSMEPGTCDHTLQHLASDGHLRGSWTTDRTKYGRRVVCGVCGRFYGYLPKLAPTPTHRPPPESGPPDSSVTGSSFCSGSDGGGYTPPAAPAPPPTSAGRRSIDFAELRRRVSMTDVLRLIEFAPTSRSGDQLRGPCPVHGSTREGSRIFSANLAKNTYRCFKADCDSKGNQLDLYVAVSHLPVYQAAIELCERLGIEVPRRGGRP